jgi:hypothetical protein
VACVLKPTYVLTVTEVWQKTMDFQGDEAAARAEADSVRRGDLSRAAEAGDTSVRTALMTVCWTMDPRDAYSIIDTVQDDGSYNRIETQGEQEGYMVDCVLGGWTHGISLEPPPFELPDELVVQILGMSGDVVGVMFTDVP